MDLLNLIAKLLKGNGSRPVISTGGGGGGGGGFGGGAGGAGGSVHIEHKEQNTAGLLFIIVVLLSLLIWFGSAIVKLENYHYAVQVGFCIDMGLEERDACLKNQETRTNPLWHLLYGLGILP